MRITIVFALVLMSAAATANDKILLAIFAHPDDAAAEMSLGCHQSQYTGDEFDSMIGDECQYGTINLREFAAQEENRDSLFGNQL